jgi:hypothetical protein
MSCISWNCHGLGNAATIKELREVAKKFAPTVLCVLETQVHKARVEEKTNAINLVGRSAIQITLNDCGAPGATFSSSLSEGARKTSHLHRQLHAIRAYDCWTVAVYSPGMGGRST